MGLIETMRSGCASTARRPLPTSSDRKTPDAWKIPARRAEYYLTKNGVPPFPAEPGQDQNGRFRQESTGRKEKGEAEKVMRKRLVARDEGLPPSTLPDGRITFNQWADWFLENRSKPPFRSEKTHRQNLSPLKLLRPRRGWTHLNRFRKDPGVVHFSSCRQNSEDQYPQQSNL